MAANRASGQGRSHAGAPGPRGLVPHQSFALLPRDANAMRNKGRCRGRGRARRLQLARRLPGRRRGALGAELRAGVRRSRARGRWTALLPATSQVDLGRMRSIRRPGEAKGWTVLIPSAQRPAFLAARGLRRRPEHRRLPFCAPGDRTCTFPQPRVRGAPVSPLMGGLCPVPRPRLTDPCRRPAWRATGMRELCDRGERAWKLRVGEALFDKAAGATAAASGAGCRGRTRDNAGASAGASGTCRGIKVAGAENNVLS
jgi:hypothetical protein